MWAVGGTGIVLKKSSTHLHKASDVWVFLFFLNHSTRLTKEQEGNPCVLCF